MSEVERSSERKPVRRRPRWEPDPLELPIGPPTGHRTPRDSDRGTSDDLPGSHVVVIDLA